MFLAPKLKVLVFQVAVCSIGEGNRALSPTFMHDGYLIDGNQYAGTSRRLCCEGLGYKTTGGYPAAHRTLTHRTLYYRRLSHRTLACQILSYRRFSAIPQPTEADLREANLQEAILHPTGGHLIGGFPIRAYLFKSYINKRCPISYYSIGGFPIRWRRYMIR